MIAAARTLRGSGIACTWHPGHTAARAVDPHLKAASAAAD